MLRSRVAPLLIAGATLFGGRAFGLGALVAPAGEQVEITASRTLVVRTADRVQLITQIKYSGQHANLAWVVPVHNVQNLDDGMVTARGFDAAALDELERLSAPSFTGACDGAPNGQEATSTFADGFGAAQAMGLPSRFFIAPQVLAGDLTTYLQTTLALETPQAVLDSIDALVDQNMMFVVLRIDTAALGVQKIDPIVAINYPLADGDPLRLGLRPISANVAAGNRAHMLFWMLGDARVRANINTREMDFAGVQFLSNTDTNYELALQGQVDTVQSQMFITEFAGSPGAFENESLQMAASTTGGYLTRLRGDFLPAALRANVATASLRDNDAPTDYAREHEVQGSDCQMLEPDMGEEPPPPDMGAGPPPPDMSEDPSDADLRRDDSGPSDEGGGGGGGGCSLAANPTGTGALGVLSLFGAALIGLRRRRP